jgi:cyanophycinase
VSALLLLAALPLPAAARRFKAGAATDATPVCAGPAYAFGGGGRDVDAAFQWLIDQVRGATGAAGPKLDVVILRCSGGDGYQAPILALNGVNSVETILGTCRADFEDPEVAASVARAEVVYFAGGNQANYVEYIRGSASDRAIRTVLAKGGGLGGTSAGAAIQGAIIHDAGTGSSTSAQALADPYHPKIHFTYGWFPIPFLADVLFETHFQQGDGGYDRLGRMLSFLARQVQDGHGPVLGLGLDAGTSLVVDKAGMATVMGRNQVQVVLLEQPPEFCRRGLPLTCTGYQAWTLGPGQRFDLAHRPGTGRTGIAVRAGILQGKPGPSGIN